MARKDLDKETERPRYYSQFWLDIAAGRRVIGAGRGAQETDETETSEAEQMPEASAKSGRGARSGASTPVVEAEPAAPKPPPQPLRLSGTESLADLVAAAGLVDIESGEEAPSLEEEDMIEDLAPLPSADVDEEAAPGEEPYEYSELYDEEEEEGEGEEEDWPSSRRGKKHTKKPDKPRRRERGRDF